MALLPTFAQLQDAARAEIQLRRPDLSDWIEGSVLDAITGAAAVLADEVIRVNVELFAELFFDSAEADALDRLAQDRFGPLGQRKPATASIGVVEWTRGTPGVAYTIFAGTRFRATANGETIEVQSTATVEVLTADTTVEVPVAATTTGRRTNAAAGTLSEIVDAVLADPLATVTNPEPLAGGSEAETDPAFRDRLRRIYSTLRRATRAALKTGALSVPGVSIVSIDESDVESSGIVRVYVGDPDARANSTLAALVATALNAWRAAGVRVEVYGSEREELSLTLQLDIASNSDRTTIAEAVRASIVAFGDTLGPGDKVHRSRVEKAAYDASDLVLGARLQSNAATISPTLPQNAIRFEANRISISFQIVAT